MRLRPRQKTFVERSVAALASRGNTLGVAPTGAGKTIMLSAVTGEMISDGAKACVLAHRDELTAQNRTKFQRVVPEVSTSVIDATEKSWGGDVTFAMVPTLARASNLSASTTCRRKRRAPHRRQWPSNRASAATLPILPSLCVAA